jgi:uncharacterized protein (DUF488 family)
MSKECPDAQTSALPVSASSPRQCGQRRCPATSLSERHLSGTGRSVAHGRRLPRFHPVPNLVTIGVYGFTAATFLQALEHADVRLLLDVRQRRGVRGSQYAWANSVRLQRALEDAGISYSHHKELAPTTELRQLQYREDAAQGVGKRSRVKLAPEYARRYTEEILDRADLGPVVASLPARGSSALLCVERDPDACHRSLIAQRMAGEHGVSIAHLQP